MLACFLLHVLCCYQSNNIRLGVDDASFSSRGHRCGNQMLFARSHCV